MMTREEKAIALLNEILNEGMFFLCAVEAKDTETCDFMAWEEKARAFVYPEASVPIRHTPGECYGGTRYTV